MGQVFKHKLSLYKRRYFEHECQVCVSAVHPDMMYNLIMTVMTLSALLAAILLFNSERETTKNRAWHGADLESAYPNFGKTTS